MATPRKHSKQKRVATGGGNRLHLVLALLSLITLIIICIVQYYLYIGTNNSLHDEQKEALFNDDLKQAVQPFEGESFPLQQVLKDGPSWGSLNSGHYFGLKLSSPESLETSLLWFVNQLNYEGGLNIRHLCDQNDRLDFYSWIRHDFYSFGQQTIEDQGYKLDTSYIKNPENSLDWQARVVINSATSKPKKPLSLILYLTIEHSSERLQLESSLSKLAPNDLREVFRVKGYSKDIGDYVFKIDFDSDTRNFRYGTYLKGLIDKKRFPISSYLMSRMLATTSNGTRLFVLPGPTKVRQQEEVKNPNIIAYQLVVEAPASFTISLRQQPQTSSSFDYEALLKEKTDNFDKEFDEKFRIETQKLAKNSTTDVVDKLARVSLSNMIGSVGYFYGMSFIGSSINTHKVAPYGPIQMLTGVPSRSFFPRGFLWDEGFHNLLISEWNQDLSNTIIRSWFDIMNINGWIPREVILGVESMRRVPEEFIIQRIANANPPAMIIVIERMLDRGTLQQATFDRIYPRLKAWYNWFNTTQFGLKHATYRWRGRDELSVTMLNPKTLTSGLDDYPRASHPSSDEYHIDLRCWMALSARALAKLAKRSGDLDFASAISSEALELRDNKLLDATHWSEKHRMYCDFGQNTENVELVLITRYKPSDDGKRQEPHQVLERRSTGHHEFGCVPEFGYVSLFPMLFGILDHSSDKLGIVLDRLRDENELWSPYGIRSLSKSSRYYNKFNTRHDKPYWRGAVWININYLILTSLKSYSKLDGPYKERCEELFIELKGNLINNVLREFSRTGYTWENYDDQTGQGRGSHPFTGWSSLILLIMSSDLD